MLNTVYKQLVIEVFVADIERSIAFYEALDFRCVRRDGMFAVMAWGDSELYLDQRERHELASGTQANVRIVVEDVDSIWARVHELGVPIHSPIGDHYYGLRDFTILDPDGFGLRFASPLVTAFDGISR